MHKHHTYSRMHIPAHGQANTHTLHTKYNGIISIFDSSMPIVWLVVMSNRRVVFLPWFLIYLFIEFFTTFLYTISIICWINSTFSVQKQHSEFPDKQTVFKVNNIGNTDLFPTVLISLVEVRIKGSLWSKF